MWTVLWKKSTIKILILIAILLLLIEQYEWTNALVIGILIIILIWVVKLNTTSVDEMIRREKRAEEYNPDYMHPASL